MIGYDAVSALLAKSVFEHQAVMAKKCDWQVKGKVALLHVSKPVKKGPL